MARGGWGRGGQGLSASLPGAAPGHHHPVSALVRHGVALYGIKCHMLRLNWFIQW